MVIYHVITYYHILKSSIHKLRFHPDEEAILLVPQTLERKCSGLFPANNDEHIFSKVFFYNWNTNPPGGDKTVKIEEISQQLNDWLGKDYLEKLNEINICSAAYYFGIWAVEKKLPFNWFEEADGLLSQPHFIQDADRRLNKVRYSMAEDVGNYTGNNPYVQKKYVKLSAQLQGFSDPLAANFDVIEEMRMLSPEHQRALLKFFDVPLDISFRDNSALMLTQHFTNMRMLSYEDQALIYQLTVDYCLCKYNLYFKWHPTDITDYTSFMENVTMISGSFPSELLTLFVKNPLEVCTSIESSGTLNLSSLCKRILLFNRDYVTTFVQNHRYYFCIKLLETLSDCPACAIGMNQRQMENLLEFGGISVKNEVIYFPIFEEVAPYNAPRIYLIGSCEDADEETLKAFYAGCHEQDIFVFLNANNENYFWPIRKTVPYLVKEIRFRALDQETYGKEEGCERMFIFTHNRSAMEKVKDMKYIKKLLQTGVETAVFASTDKDVQIAALSGMLRATEAQLDKYVEENKALKKSLNFGKD